MSWAQRIDKMVFLAIFEQWFDRPVWPKFLKIISKTADGYFLIITLVVGITIQVSPYDYFKVFVLSVVFEKSAYLILKNILKRPRPFKTIAHTQSRLNPFDEFSFPSGHTGSAFVLAFIIQYYFHPLLAIATFLWAIMVGVSRIHLGVHYPSDTIAGATLGALAFFIARWIV